MSRLKRTSWPRRRLRRQLKEARDARRSRRTLAGLELDRGRSAADSADLLGVTRPSVPTGAAASRRDPDRSAWADDDRAGRPRLLTEDTADLLRSLLAGSPQPLGPQATSGTVPLRPQKVERGTGQRPWDDTVRRGRKRLGSVGKRPRSVLAPDPEREKITADPAADPGPAAPERRAGRGRDRPPAVPASEGTRGGAGRTGPGRVGRGPRPGVVVDAMNLGTGTRWLWPRPKGRRADFPAFRDAVRRPSWGRHMALLWDEDPSPTAQASWKAWEGITLRGLPKRSPALHPRDTLGGQGQDVISAAKPYGRVEEQGDRFLKYR